MGTFNPRNTKPREDFPLIPPGEYLVRIIKVEVRYPDDPSKKPRIEIRLRILNGANRRRVLFDGFNIEPDKTTMDRFGDCCVAAGYDGDGFDDENQHDLDAVLLGRVVKVKTTNSEWPKGSGQMRSKVAYRGYAAAKPEDTFEDDGWDQEAEAAGSPPADDIPPPGDEDAPRPPPQRAQPQRPVQPAANPRPAVDSDDEIPF